MTTFRFFQAHREARWSCALTLLYLLGWAACAYGLGDAPGVTGLPLWFEWSCLFLPLIFMGLCALMVHCVFREVSLEAGADGMMEDAVEKNRDDHAH